MTRWLISTTFTQTESAREPSGRVSELSGRVISQLRRPRLLPLRGNP